MSDAIGFVEVFMLILLLGFKASLDAGKSAIHLAATDEPCALN
jgi:hypothetical protein